MNKNLPRSFAFRALMLCVLTTSGGYSSLTYAQHCGDETIVLFRVSGNEDPAHIAALPALADLVASSDGGWQSRAHSLADVAARVNQVGQYAPAPVVQPQPTAIVSAARPTAVNPVASVATTAAATPTASIPSSGRPSVPTRPAAVVLTVTPATPARPATPAVPATPVVPAVPATPAVPAVPETQTPLAVPAHSGGKTQ